MNKFEIQRIKQVAKFLDRDIQKREKLHGEITKLGNQYDEVCQSIEKWDNLIKEMTGGYGVEDLIIKVKNPGKPTSFVLRYPDTIIPPQILENAEQPIEVADAKVDEEEISHEDVVADEKPAAQFVNNL